MGGASPARYDELQHKLFVGGISHKCMDSDLKQEMHGAILEGRRISVTRAVPETQTMPGTPAPLLAAGKGIRGGRGIRGSAWEGTDGIRGSPRSARGGRGKRFERGGRYKPGGSSGRSRGRSPLDRHYRGNSRDRSRSISIDRQSSGSSGDSQRSLQRPHGTPAQNFPPYESALTVLRSAKYDASGFKEYMSKCKPLDMAVCVVLHGDDGGSPDRGKRKEPGRRASLDHAEKDHSAWPKRQSTFHDTAPSGVGGMRGAVGPRDQAPYREHVSGGRGRPERYSRD